MGRGLMSVANKVNNTFLFVPIFSSSYSLLEIAWHKKVTPPVIIITDMLELFPIAGEPCGV